MTPQQLNTYLDLQRQQIQACQRLADILEQLLQLQHQSPKQELVKRWFIDENHGPDWN